MKSAVLLLALGLSGCMTCREYPTACAAVAIVGTGCLALLAGSSNPQHPHNNVPSICTGELSCR